MSNLIIIIQIKMLIGEKRGICKMRSKHIGRHEAEVLRLPMGMPGD